MIPHNDQTAPPLSETEVTAYALGLPKVIWQQNPYRIVAWFDEEDNQIRRTPEYLDGLDRLGVERWSIVLPELAWDETRKQYLVPAKWKDLALFLLDEAAPLPGSENQGQQTVEPGSENKGPAARPRPLSADKIVAAESALLDAYMGVNAAYRISDASKVDAHLMVAQDALEKLATMLGLDPFREPVSEPLSSIQGDA